MSINHLYEYFEIRASIGLNNYYSTINQGKFHM